MKLYFDKFRRLFPLTDLEVGEDALRRKFADPTSARHFELRACEIILENALPLVAAVEPWTRRGVVFEINLVIEMAPEEYDFADEVQDCEGLMGGWYNTKSE